MAIQATRWGHIQDKLKEYKFSDRHYSIYSLRSTFIENNLVVGMDIFLLAHIRGYRVKMLTKHYERIDICMRAEEITHINCGKKQQNGGVQVQLFE